MGRPGITYNDVVVAVETLMATNPKPTFFDVRNQLGDTGSFTTIKRHLREWEDSRPKVHPAPIEVPADVIQAMNRWALQTSTALRSTAEESLSRAIKESDDLMRALEISETERADLEEQVLTLKTERDQEQGTAQARAAEIDRLTQDIERERDLAGKAQVAAAEVQLRAESQTQHLADLKATVERLTEKVETETKARIEAERNAAVLTAERDAARKDVDQGIERIAGLEMHLDVAHQKAEQRRAEHEKRLAEAAQAIAAERAGADKERRTAHAAAVENATLKAQLTNMTKEATVLTVSLPN